ncbi:MAG: nitroreductase family protein [Candidatus Zhuqueibacterota bacterium]
MDFNEVIRNRYSVRAYLPKPVEEEKLNQVLEAAVIAPTAANRQPFKIYVIEISGRESQLRRLYGRDWFVQAPLVIGIVALEAEGWSRMDGKNYAEVDTTIAFDHLVLAAANLGLGTCWIAAFNPGVARELLNLEPGMEPIAFTPLGYPADALKAKTRKKLTQLVTYMK